MESGGWNLIPVMVIHAMAIIAENVKIGNNAVVGTGEYTPNRIKPDVYTYGLAVVGEGSVIPAGVRIGRNTAVTGKTAPEDYPEGVLRSGEILNKEEPFPQA